MKPPAASKTTSRAKLSTTKHLSNHKNHTVMETKNEEKDTIMEDEYARDMAGCLLTSVGMVGIAILAIFGIIYLFT